MFRILAVKLGGGGLMNSKTQRVDMRVSEFKTALRIQCMCEAKGYKCSILGVLS
jgi:hypothetical protein